MKNKVYKSAPLPFQGQKRRFAKHVKTALDEFEGANTFVDLFGGSGLLSHLVKNKYPTAKVVYNDFDDYHVRLANVGRTNNHLEYIRLLVKNCPEDKKLPLEVKEKIIEYLRVQDNTGFVDYITLSSSLLFSMNYVKNLEGFHKQTMYNSVRKSNYKVEQYLDGIDVVKYDYKELFNKYKEAEGVVFLVDPPYLSTDVGTYKNYWRLADYLDVLNVLKDQRYMYFTSNKSSILELCEWMELNLNSTNPFAGANKIEENVRLNHSAGYTDIMLYKPTYTTNTTVGNMNINYELK